MTEQEARAIAEAVKHRTDSELAQAFAWFLGELARLKDASKEARMRDALLIIRDKLVPALLQDSLEADKVNCNAQSIRGVIARILPECDYPKCQSQEE